MGLLALSSCQAPGPDPALPDSPHTLVFEMKTKERTYDGCVAGSPDCAYIRFDYPVIAEAPEGTAIESVTETIRAFLLQPLHEGEDVAETAQVLDGFIEDYRQFRAKQPRSEQVWFLERKAFVVGNRPDVLSLSFSEKSYLGGAQGSETLLFLNIDPQSGGTIALDEVLRQGAHDTLVKLAETRFRQVRQIDEGTSLAEAGFTFPNGEFHLTENFSIGAKGLTFYYNPYEVGPYALGPTELLLTYSELRDLVKPRYLENEPT